MDNAKLAGVACRVIDEAENILGPQSDPALLERYARDAILELWCRRGEITVAVARQVIADAKSVIAQRHSARQQGERGSPVYRLGSPEAIARANRTGRSSPERMPGLDETPCLAG